MADYLSIHSETYYANYNLYGDQILIYIQNNPGCNRDEILNNTGLSTTIINVILPVLIRVQFIVARVNQTGIMQYYSAPYWYNILYDNVTNVDTWLIANDDATLSDMSVALSLPWTVCQELARIAEQKALIKLIGI